MRQHLARLKAEATVKPSAIKTRRVQQIEAELHELVHGRPDLVGLAAPVDPDAAASPMEFYFCPSHDSEEIYTRLVKSIRTTLSHDTPLVARTTGERELVELCAHVWRIQNKSILDLRVSFGFWTYCLGKESESEESIGNRRMLASSRKREGYAQEFGWGERVLEDLLEVTMEMSDGLEEQQVCCFPS